MTARQLHRVLPLWPAERLNPAEHEPWMDQARCAETDPDAFFPEKGQSNRPAKQVCSGCEVSGECLSYALRHDIREGIWGGTSEQQRRQLRKRHEQQEAAA
jgi:WhiB family transcriptional regulator, redox-sensing transcriptional regulator